MLIVIRDGGAEEALTPHHGCDIECQATRRPHSVGALTVATIADYKPCNGISGA
jgi:hypothetical protein